ncbi:telomere-associated protein Tap [Streptomyces sp. NPDC004286]|uniref:telomere-associated protein Tap n=1 Tax=Streptomyces sp. NPDC004286 TaxID=3364696 RepID=UPI00368DDE19
MGLQEELFASVDELAAESLELPPPAERVRLREAAGVTQARLAKALQTTVQTAKNYESNRTKPREPRLSAYRRLLDRWAEMYPAPGVVQLAADPVPAAAPVAPAAPVSEGPIVTAAPADEPEPAPASEPAAAAPVSAPARSSARPGAAVRRPAARKKGATADDPRYALGPLLVLDGDGTAYGRNGVMLECPARTVPKLVEWTLAQPVGAPALNRNGQPSDPLIVLTAQAAVQLGLPERLEGHEQRASLRLPEDHPVVKQIGRAKWKLTRRGFGPWARVYRPAKAGRQCVQIAVLSWGALDERSWPGLAAREPEEIASALTRYADMVITPRGGTAVNGLELMTALRPPTRAARDESGNGWVSAHVPGSLGTQPVDPAPPEATPEHPLAQGWEHYGFQHEEAYGWTRDLETVDYVSEAAMPFALGLDVNAAFLAAASRTPVGLCAPVHVKRPAFDKKVPGSWLVDLSHIELDLRLPSPFTPSGERPTGPAWYQTHTVAYAIELGNNVEIREAYVRPEYGAFLDPWHDRLKAALLDTMADLGVTPGMDDDAFLAAMARVGEGDAALRAVLAAIKGTAKGGIGKLQSRARGLNYVRGERWPELERPTWRPDIRAAVISKARVNMHRKMRMMASVGLFPLGVLSDCVVYPSPTASPADLLPRTGSGKPLPGAFRLGVAPGLVKLEGMQTAEWAIDLIEQGGNPAESIKGNGHSAVLDDGE